MHDLTALRHLGILLILSLLLGCDMTNTPPNGPDSSVSAPRPRPASPPQIEFVRGYASGYERAQQAGKPMLVFFTAEWCHYCRQMAREVFTDRRVVQLSRQFVCVLVDADEEPEVCRRFQVRGYPTVQFICPRGIPLNRLSGKTPVDQFARQMQAALQAIASRVQIERTRRS